MSLVSQINSAPIPCNTDRGDETLALYCDPPGNMGALIRGTSGCSPYLRGLLEQEVDWLKDQWHREPWEVFNAILGAVTDGNFDALSQSLRIAKRRVALLTAICDLGGVWPLEDVTKALTLLSDFAVQTSLRSLLSAEIARGKLPDVREEDLENCAGMVVLAMGKGGAFELNYSSDIDLIVLFDGSQYNDENFHEVRAGFIRVTKRMCKMLSDVTRDGYVFRTDLRLRPDPSVTPVCLSMEAAERYYESLGRTWERAAFIKARPCAGDIQAGNDFLKRLRPFIWRKHLDFAAIQDAHDMRLRIRDHKGLGGKIKLMGHNMKLGRGGIREIEFFTQTRQLIAGGRDENLRSNQTLPALQSLAQKGWVPQVTADALTEAYREHRTLEHRIQMLNDAQTHDLPTSEDQMECLANLCGESSLNTFKEKIRATLDLVHELTEGFFKPDDQADVDVEISQQSAEIIQSWEKLAVLRTERATASFNRLRPAILARIAKASNPAEALVQLDGFLKGLPASVQLFSLFEANPQILDLLIDICATAPVLAGYLSKNAQVFDAVLSQGFFEPLADVDSLANQLQSLVAETSDYEDALNAIRRWMKELHFRVGVHQLRGIADPLEASQGYSNIADACLRAVFPVVAGNFAKRHGPLPNKGAALLAMGKLGSWEMTATSDIDLIVIYDGEGVEASDGPKPLPVSTYYARFTQSLVTALTSPMAEGKLYEIDMRLRPSGRKGPVATSFLSFDHYQKQEAWTWEHLALSRSRTVVGPESLLKKINAVRTEVLTRKKQRDKIISDVAEMRDRLAQSKSSTDDIWDVKSHKGGLLDIELVAQTSGLLGAGLSSVPQKQLEDAVRLGEISGKTGQVLIETHRLLANVQHISRLLVKGTFDPRHLGQGAEKHLLKSAKFDSLEDLERALAEGYEKCEAIIDAFLRTDLDAN